MIALPGQSNFENFLLMDDDKISAGYINHKANLLHK